ncbi:LOW QUALITY PROTEIN: MACPF domain-containing protein At1g14780 [Salvia miltiorrhiza]|uniref:LOW QUALITY PROTEIN: MACPF domain-containing protein At1g14780 n=1 Tax=Salvia miltiorrhiza TaxID=226208 RepID=UPI0025AC3236|nr:LOW QUALITY PROTEIN: MACPF domain-containing protein At1g14780 [Salvia miltiorrhiza]
MNDGIVQRALSSLGKGFDLSSDFRLKYCKGDERLVVLNESDTRELRVPGFGSLADVSNDIKCDKGERTRYQTDILDFKQMSEFFNQKCSLPGKIPSGLFNAMFGFQSGSWAVDASNTKNLGLDGYFIVLFTLHIHRYPLILAPHVRNAVPSKWDPAALARFIEKYGTHIIVGLSIGGEDVILVKQEKCSNMEASQLKNHLDNLGDQLFTGACTFSPHQCTKTKDQKNKAPQAFSEIFDPQPNLFSNYASATAKDGISVICCRRGGDSKMGTHCEWLPTVASNPDAIHFNFIPITSLLRGVPGKGFLSHAINLYLRYKPPIGDLQYFLDFQAHKIWAPIHNDLPLGPKMNKAFQTPSLNFNLMGPKLYVNTTQVTAGNTPVTGMRLYLEGIKSNRLGIHLQQLVNPPVLLEDKLQQSGMWRSTEEAPEHHRYLEAIQWKKFSHVCTAPVKYDPQWLNPGAEAAFIVTGAQLHVSKDVLHLRLLYTRVSAAYIVHSNWMQTASANHSLKSGFFSSISTSITDKEKSAPVIVDSGVYPTGPPAPTAAQKLLKFVDTTQLCRGPSDSPGHWLVTGAKLDVEKRKICLRVKFSLLNLSSPQ